MDLIQSQSFILDADQFVAVSHFLNVENSKSPTKETAYLGLSYSFWEQPGPTREALLIRKLLQT